jgi:hypothetical protein
MRIPRKDILQCIMEQYNLFELVHNDHVLVEIRNGMYGLPQAGILANDILVKHLAKYGYRPTACTPRLYTHATRPITFAVVVNEFGVKYVGKENAEHLGAAICDLYTTTEDWEGKLYIGITLKWNYQARTVDLSMPGYIDKAIAKCLHKLTLQATTLTTFMGHTHLRRKSAIHGTQRHFQTSHKHREDVPSRSCWHTSLLCVSHQFGTPRCSWIYSDHTNHGHRSNRKSHHTTPQLLRYAP